MTPRPRPTTFYCPADAAGLLAHTREVALLDMRVATVAARLRPARPAQAQGEDESDVEYASRVWRRILPGDDANDLCDFREITGWTTTEVDAVVALLDAVITELEGDTNTAVLSGTSETLRRDITRVRRVRNAWTAIADAVK